MKTKTNTKRVEYRKLFTTIRKRSQTINKTIRKYNEGLVESAINIRSLENTCVTDKNEIIQL